MEPLLHKIARRAFRACGLTVERCRTDGCPTDFTDEDAELVRRVRPYTMTSHARMYAMLRAVDHVVRHSIAGSIAECGVWRGGSMMLAALRLIQHGAERELYLYDTFDGMTRPEAVDVGEGGLDAGKLFDRTQNSGGGSDWCRATVEDVRAAMASTGYNPDRYHLIKGTVEETLPAQAPERLALLRLDTDWYESTKHELQHLYPRLSSGGVLIIDDYGYWKGARKATDEFTDALAEPVFLHRIDSSARLIIKP